MKFEFSPNSKVFQFFLQKNLSIKVEKTFKEMISFDTNSTANLPLLSIMIYQFIFQKKPELFSYNLVIKKFQTHNRAFSIGK